MLGMSGWFSTNILGNRDGEVPEDPGLFKSKAGLLSVLQQTQPDLYPQLYKDFLSRQFVSIADRHAATLKKCWDNIDISGWPVLDADEITSVPHSFWPLLWCWICSLLDWRSGGE